MLNPQPAAGHQAVGSAEVQLAVTALQSAMTKVGALSKKGGAILKAITALTAEFKDVEDQGKQIMPAQLMSILKRQGGAGAGAGAPGGAGPGGPPPGAAPPMAA